MFSYPNPIVMILAVLIGLAFIVFSVYSTNKLFYNKTQDVLVRFILLVFSALVGVFVVDKVVAFKINLLSQEQNQQLFELIKTLTLMIFSYYFGSQKAKTENQNESD